jgi:hypothetical protein
MLGGTQRANLDRHIWRWNHGDPVRTGTDDDDVLSGGDDTNDFTGDSAMT